MTRARGITEEAADAAVDTACRMLRLPTIRDQFTATAAAPSGRSAAPGSLARNGSPTSTTTPTPASPRP
jgi:hypothetical protein